MVRTHAFHHAHILVIDDEGTTLPLMRKFLQHAGYHSIATSRARSPEAALLEITAHRGQQFDPAVVDALFTVVRDVLQLQELAS